MDTAKVDPRLRGSLNSVIPAKAGIHHGHRKGGSPPARDDEFRIGSLTSVIPAKEAVKEWRFDNCKDGSKDM
jgi:hypothetical protein